MSERENVYPTEIRKHYNYSGEGGTVDVRDVSQPFTYSPEELEQLKRDQAERLEEVRTQIQAAKPQEAVRPAIHQFNYSGDSEWVLLSTLKPAQS